MPNVKSAIKRAETSRVRRGRNRRDRSRLRNAIKRVRQAQDPQVAEESLQRAVSLLDRFARKGLIHPNKAARDKSRLTRFTRALVDKAAG